MCEFCHRHGEGRKWYLEASNYSEDMLSDSRRRGFVERFVRDPGAVLSGARHFETLSRLPRIVRSVLARAGTGIMKRVHYGQVVPIEDVRTIFGMVNSIVRVACVCRHFTQGAEKRFCYGMSMSPDGGILGGIFRSAAGRPGSGPYSAGAETMTAEEALREFEGYERHGMCHTVWTFHTPFICGMCNCDREGCIAVRTAARQGIRPMFRAEYVAACSPGECTGCRQCGRVCQFEAIAFDGPGAKAVIDPARCYGCGICRSVCSGGAILLRERGSVAEAAGIW
jgi:ferredoxin